jgi:hypothetical protein
LTAIQGEIQSTSSWILDSGASRHICKDNELFENLEKLDSKLSITFGDGKAITAEFQGNVVFETYTSRITLSEVLYVPQASFNLNTIPQATKMGAPARFDRGVCEISRRGKIILRGLQRWITALARPGNL